MARNWSVECLISDVCFFIVQSSAITSYFARWFLQFMAFLPRTAELSTSPQLTQLIPPPPLHRCCGHAWMINATVAATCFFPRFLTCVFKKYCVVKRCLVVFNHKVLAEKSPRVFDVYYQRPWWTIVGEKRITRLLFLSLYFIAPGAHAGQAFGGQSYYRGEPWSLHLSNHRR